MTLMQNNRRGREKIESRLFSCWSYPILYSYERRPSPHCQPTPHNRAQTRVSHLHINTNHTTAQLHCTTSCVLSLTIRDARSDQSPRSSDDADSFSFASCAYSDTVAAAPAAARCNVPVIESASELVCDASDDAEKSFSRSRAPEACHESLAALLVKRFLAVKGEEHRNIRENT